MSEAGDTASHVGSSEKNSSSSTLREFLWQHVEVAHSKGFDDNVGRNPPPAIFEVCAAFHSDFVTFTWRISETRHTGNVALQMPTAETWFDVACSLLSYFTADYLETRARPHFNSLQSHLDLNMRFSERWVRFYFWFGTSENPVTEAVNVCERERCVRGRERESDPPKFSISAAVRRCCQWRRARIRTDCRSTTPTAITTRRSVSPATVRMDTPVCM